MRKPARRFSQFLIQIASRLLLLQLALALSACSLLGLDSGDAASVSLGIQIVGLGPEPSQALARSLWPNGSSDFFRPFSYRVNATGPGGQYIDRSFSATDPVRLTDLLPGTWTINSCWAYNSSGDAIALSDPATIVLGPGQTASLPLTLEPRWSDWSDGTFNLNLNWNPPFLAQSANAADANPSTITLTGLLGDGEGNSIDLGTWVSSWRDAISGSRSLRPRLWRLDICLNEYGDCDGDGTVGQPAYWGLSEIVYIAPYRTTDLNRFLGPAELRQAPAPVAPNLSGGVVVCDPADLHPSWISFPGLQAGSRVIYSYNGNPPACDALGNPAVGSFALDPGERVRMGKAEDSAWNGNDGVIRLSWITWNPWGQTTQVSTDYYLDEAVFVDVAASLSMKRGTKTDPYTYATEGVARAGGLGRDEMTAVRLAKGSYMEMLGLPDGVLLSGSWTNAAGSWSRDTAALSDPATYTSANASVFSFEPSSDAVVYSYNAQGMGIRMEYLAIDGPLSQPLPALYIGWSDRPLELDYLRLTGRTGANDATALLLSFVSSVVMRNCLVEGRASSVSPTSGSSTALLAQGSRLDAQDSRFIAGPAAASWAANGVRSSGSTILLNGGECRGAAIGSLAAASFGLYADSMSFIGAVGTDFDSGYADASGSAIGIDLNTAWADLDGVSVIARDACAESIAIRYADGIGDYNCGSYLESWQRLLVRGGSDLAAGFPGAIPALRSTGLRILSGRASIESCQLIEAGPALQDSTGIWAGFTAYGHWADVKITGNSSIAAGYAQAGLGAGIRIEGAIRASIAGNLGTAAQPGISGGSGGSSQTGIRIISPAAITVYPEGSCISIDGNSIQGNAQGGAAAFASYGIWMDGGSAARPILISRNRIHAGKADDGPLAGIWSSFNSSSGSSGADIVVRNNAISGGSYADAVVGPWRAAVYHSRESGHGQPFFLLSNTLIGPEGPNTLSAPVARTAPLVLMNLSSPVILNDILIARPWNRAALIRETDSAIPLALDHDAFFAGADNDALWWSEDSGNSSNDPNGTSFFATGLVPAANISLSTASIFSSPLPASAATFFSHSFALKSPQASGDEGLLNGGIDLSAYSVQGAAASPWWFDADLAGAARSAPWSIGAREVP